MLQPQTILGIDPALGTTGYGLIRCSGNSIQLVDAGVIRCRRDRPLEDRLGELFDGMREILEELKPDHFAIEQLYSHYDRPTTAILMGHARGVILLAAQQAGVRASGQRKERRGNRMAPAPFSVTYPKTFRR